MSEAFRGRIPPSLLYSTAHDVWVRSEGESVVIGATSYGAYFAGELLAFTPKRVGAEIAIERSLGVVEVAKTLVAVHSPLTLRITAVNDEAVRRPRLINSDPYGSGWMVQGVPLRWADECAGLVAREAYAAHVREHDPDAQISA